MTNVLNLGSNNTILNKYDINDEKPQIYNQTI